MCSVSAVTVSVSAMTAPVSAVSVSVSDIAVSISDEIVSASAVPVSVSDEVVSDSAVTVSVSDIAVLVSAGVDSVADGAVSVSDKPVFFVAVFSCRPRGLLWRARRPSTRLPRIGVPLAAVWAPFRGVSFPGGWIFLRGGIHGRRGETEVGPRSGLPRGAESARAGDRVQG